MKKKKADSIVRSIKIKVSCPDKKERAKLYGAIKFFRYVSRRTMAAYSAVEIACTDIKVNDEGFLTFASKANHEQIENVLKTVFQTKRAHSVEEYIKELAPEWQSDTIQECWRLIKSRWSAKLPDSNLRMGAAMKLGQRDSCMFRFTALPIKWCPTCQSNVKFDGHEIKIKWAYDFVTLKIGTLDPWGWSVLRRIGTGELPPGGASIGLSDKGKLSLRLGYHLPVRTTPAPLDPSRVMEVAFNDDPKKAIICSLREGHNKVTDEIVQRVVDAEASIKWVDRLKAQMDKLESEKEGCGNSRDRRNGTGHAKAFAAISKRSHGLAVCRENGTRTWNHTWAKYVVRAAVNWDCGSIQVMDLPKKEKDGSGGGICGRPWPWSDFMNKLAYRCEEEGIRIIEEEKTQEEKAE